MYRVLPFLDQSGKFLVAIQNNQTQLVYMLMVMLQVDMRYIHYTVKTKYIYCYKS